MEIRTHPNRDELGQRAAEEGAAAIRNALDASGRATIIVATGASQFAMLDALVTCDIDWSRVTAFHLDEYVGLPASHKASFRGYLRSRFVERVGSLKEFVEVGGDAVDLEGELARLNGRLGGELVDVCFAGIGEKTLVLNARRITQRIHGDQLILLAIEDITEHRRAQQIITDREAWFRNLADNAPIMIWVTDKEKKTSFLNKAWLEFRGDTMEEGLRKGWCGKRGHGCRNHKGFKLHSVLLQWHQAFRPVRIDNEGDCHLFPTPVPVISTLKRLSQCKMKFEYLIIRPAFLCAAASS